MKNPNTSPAMLLANLWVIGIISITLNAFLFKFRSKKYILEKPQLSEGYEKIFKGFLFWGNLPWIVVGVGCIFGGIPSFFHFLHPKDGNPYVLAFFGVVCLEWIMGTNWLFFRGGAQMLVDHPGLLVMRGGGNITNPSFIKLLWMLMLLAGVVGIFMMWTRNISMPSFAS